MSAGWGMQVRSWRTSLTRSSTATAHLPLVPNSTLLVTARSCTPCCNTSAPLSPSRPDRSSRRQNHLALIYMSRIGRCGAGMCRTGPSARIRHPGHGLHEMRRNRSDRSSPRPQSRSATICRCGVLGCGRGCLRCGRRNVVLSRGCGFELDDELGGYPAAVLEVMPWLLAQSRISVESRSPGPGLRRVPAGLRVPGARLAAPVKREGASRST